MTTQQEVLDSYDRHQKVIAERALVVYWAITDWIEAMGPMTLTDDMILTLDAARALAVIGKGNL